MSHTYTLKKRKRKDWVIVVWGNWISIFMSLLLCRKLNCMTKWHYLLTNLWNRLRNTIISLVLFRMQEVKEGKIKIKLIKYVDGLREPFKTFSGASSGKSWRHSTFPQMSVVHAASPFHFTCFLILHALSCKNITDSATSNFRLIQIQLADYTRN